MSLINEFFQGREMLRAGEVAERLDIHINTLNGWIKMGVDVPFHQVPGVGRMYDWAEIEPWYAARRKAHPKVIPKTPVEIANAAIRAWEQRQKKEAA